MHETSSDGVANSQSNPARDIEEINTWQRSAEARLSALEARLEKLERANRESALARSGLSSPPLDPARGSPEPAGSSDPPLLLDTESVRF